MSALPQIPLAFVRRAPEEMAARARDFYAELKRRRTVRDFSPEPVPRAVIFDCIRAAGSAPNGANLQPWHFAVIEDPALKRKVRLAAEAEERAFYGGRASDEWLAALEPLGTDASKPFLETAPFLIAVFAQNHGVAEDGSKIRHYYVKESVGIASGFLLAALHHAGLATLTHTPSPMGFLRTLCRRPANEKAMMLVVVGYPAQDATVPEITKKRLDEICTVVAPDE